MDATEYIYTSQNECQDDILFEPIPNTNFLVPVSFFRNIECTGRVCRNCGEYAGVPICNTAFDQLNTHMQWHEFVARLTKFSKIFFENKIAAPLFAPTIFRKERAKRADGTYYQGWRCEPNATNSRMAVNDLDNDFTFPRVHQFLIEHNLEALLWTTASHTLAAPRLRLVIPYAAEVDGEMHEIATRSIIATIEPGHKLNDTTKLGLESLAYVPGVYGCAEENKFVHTTGRVLSAEEWFELGELSLEESRGERPEPTWTGSLSTNTEWSYDEALDRYLSKTSHRHPGLCGFATSVAMRALRAGYDLSDGELADIIERAQRLNRPSKPYTNRDIGRLARSALIYAENNIDVPAHILREQAWERKSKEMLAMIDGSLWEPEEWPAEWTEQAQKTISNLQDIRSTPKTMDYGKHYDPHIDDDCGVSTS